MSKIIKNSKDIEKSLGVKDKFLSIQWDYFKNNWLTPFDVFHKSRMRAWWICSNGHSFSSRIDSLASNKNTEKEKCPYCSKKKISYENSLKFLFPKIAEEVVGLDTSLLFAYSSEKVKFCCRNGHEWVSKISDRTNRGNGCPFCSGRKINDDNSLLKLFPLLCDEWDYGKNTLDPNKISPWTHQYAWWKCNKSFYSWESQVNGRNVLGRKCPMCVKNIKLDNDLYFDSIAEAYYYLKYLKDNKKFLYNKEYPKCKNESIGRSRYDFYIINENKYVEVTGYNSRWKEWCQYMDKINRKKHYVENVLGANFEFIQLEINKKISDFVFSYIKGSI